MTGARRPAADPGQTSGDRPIRLSGASVELDDPDRRVIGPPVAHVLIASRDQASRNTLRSVLDDDTRFEVVAEVRSGDEAVEWTDLVDAVIVDLDLVGLGCMATISGVRRHHPHSAVVAMADERGSSMRQAFLDEGADAYVPKLEIDTLPGRLGAMIEQRRGYPSTIELN
jgi:DNA-binding NarL/FixJ family response regulator